MPPYVCTAGVKKPLGKVQLNKYMSEDITNNTHKSLSRYIYSIWGEKIYVNLNILQKISFYDLKNGECISTLNLGIWITYIMWIEILKNKFIDRKEY